MTQMKRHRVTCAIWEARDKNAVAVGRIKAAFEKKYGEGVTNAVLVPGAAEKKATTMKDRYGAENPFARESSLFDQVQSHWDGKDRTAHLPKDNFSKPEIKEKIRKTNLERYGAENPSQSPEIRAKQLATSLERYGDEQALRVPSIRAKGVQTNLNRLGVSDSMQSEEVKEKVRQTNLKRYGVEWTTQNQGVFNKLRESHFARFGKWFGATDQWKLGYMSEIELHQAKLKQTCLDRYGANNYMKVPHLAAKALEHSRRAGPNKPELKFNELYPFFCFSGNGSFWKQIPSTKQNRNPDFCFPVYPKMDGSPSFGSVTHVVEVFGDYWHGESRTGEPDNLHVQKTVDAWAEAGLKCLVVWEHELMKVAGFSLLDQRIQSFLENK